MTEKKKLTNASFGTKRPQVRILSSRLCQSQLEFQAGFFVVLRTLNWFLIPSKDAKGRPNEKMMKPNIEIMAPVGSYEALSAAIQAGAGSVYFGIGKLNMRSRSAKNFTLDDLRQLAETCNENGVKSYVTVNTIIYDEEMEEMHQLLNAIKANGISAIIASDQSVIQYARQIGIEVHMSTQCNITNLEAVRYYSQFADVMNANKYAVPMVI